jgi:hypothetical protein
LDARGGFIFDFNAGAEHGTCFRRSVVLSDVRARRDCGAAAMTELEPGEVALLVSYAIGAFMAGYGFGYLLRLIKIFFEQV